MNPIIHFDGVTKRYGSKAALDSLTFDVGEGEFFGFLGPNGAGKTTTIKTIIGLVKPDEGTVLIDGIDVQSDPLPVRAIVGYVPDNPFIYGKLTAREFLVFVGGLYRLKKNEIYKRIEWLCDIFDMHGWIDRRTEEYSFGMKKKVVMSASFIHKPKLIVVDEPTVGLDPPSARLLKDMLLKIREHGTTIFMSSHDLSVVEELSTTMAILHNGKIVAEGTLDTLREKAEMEAGTLEQLFFKLTDHVAKDIYME